MPQAARSPRRRRPPRWWRDRPAAGRSRTACGSPAHRRRQGSGGRAAARAGSPRASSQRLVQRVTDGPTESVATEGLGQEGDSVAHDSVVDHRARGESPGGSQCRATVQADAAVGQRDFRPPSCPIGARSGARIRQYRCDVIGPLPRGRHRYVDTTKTRRLASGRGTAGRDATLQGLRPSAMMCT